MTREYQALHPFKLVRTHRGTEPHHLQVNLQDVEVDLMVNRTLTSSSKYEMELLIWTCLKQLQVCS